MATEPTSWPPLGRSWWPSTVNPPHLVALVRARAPFVNGKLIEGASRGEPAASRL